MTSFQRARDGPLGRGMNKYFRATAGHPFPSIAEMTVIQASEFPKLERNIGGLACKTFVQYALCAYA